MFLCSKDQEQWAHDRLLALRPTQPAMPVLHGACAVPLQFVDGEG